jgi:ubiquinone/menaquinone biosynthesis C-methylase UbiE
MPSFSRSRIAAWLQEIVSQRREEVGLYREIAAQLPLPGAGRVLDVGTGSGLQLKAIHDVNPDLELYGLDLSAHAIRVARRHLQGMEVDLREGSIESAPYDDDFFDIVTCNASMSYWKNPVSCFDEVYRILKAGGSAVLFEPQKDIDMDEVVETIRANLADKSRLRRFAAISLNKFGLRWGRTVGLKLYSMSELEEIAHRSRFGHHASIERTTLQNLPIFARITLMKPSHERQQ